MDKKIYGLINDQINKELYSAYLYLDMANYYAQNGLSGFESWFTIQAREEFEHAMKLSKYLIENEEKPVFETIAKPDKVYNKLSEPLDEALKHERYATALINNIFSEAVKANDFRTQEFLRWFIAEQAEEEVNATGLIEKMKYLGESKEGVYYLDKELGERK